MMVVRSGLLGGEMDDYYYNGRERRLCSLVLALGWIHFIPHNFTAVINFWLFEEKLTLEWGPRIECRFSRQQEEKRDRYCCTCPRMSFFPIKKKRDRCLCSKSKYPGLEVWYVHTVMYDFSRTTLTLVVEINLKPTCIWQVSAASSSCKNCSGGGVM